MNGGVQYPAMKIDQLHFGRGTPTETVVSRDIPAPKPIIAPRDRGTPYTEIDIESSPGAAEDVIRHVGKRAIPQFVVDGKWIQPYKPGKGFLYEEMETFFGVTSI